MPPSLSLFFFLLPSCALHPWEEECIFQYSWRSKFSWKRGGLERDPASLGIGWGCQKQLQDLAKPPSHSRNQRFPTADLLACFFSSSSFFPTTSHSGCDLCPLLNMTRLPCNAHTFRLLLSRCLIWCFWPCVPSPSFLEWKLWFITLFELQFSSIEDLLCWCWSENMKVGREPRERKERRALMWRGGWLSAVLNFWIILKGGQISSPGQADYIFGLSVFHSQLPSWPDKTVSSIREEKKKLQKKKNPLDVFVLNITHQLG